MSTYRIKDFLFIKYILVIVSLLFFASNGQAQSNLNVEISRQSATSAAETVTQNLQLFQEIADGNVNPTTVASTLISDTDAALKVYEQYLRYQSNIIQNQISSLKLHISSASSIFSRTPSNQFDDTLEALLAAVDDLEAEKLALIRNADAASGLAKTMTFFSYAGNTFSVIDTGIKANALLNAIKSDADELSTGIAAADLTVSSALTSFALAGSKYTPLVGLVYSGTEITKWYADTLGDAVRDEADGRTEAIAQEIDNAGERVQSRIIGLYRNGNAPSDEEVRRIAREEYVKVLDFITSFYDDIGFLESVFGIYGSNTEYIDQQFDLVMNILNNRVGDRAVKFSNDIRERQRAIDVIFNEIEESEKILRETSLGGDNIFINIELGSNVEDMLPIIEGDADSSSPIVDEQDNADRTNEDKVVIGDSSVPEEPAGPTAEEIAEAERLAEEQRLASIANLRAQRDTYSLTQQDAQARLQERRNRLTVLQFNELEKVQNAGTVVRSRISELRVEQNDTGLSAADQQLLLDLVRYEDRLQTEQERIAGDITSAQSAISTYEAALSQATSQLTTNAASLANLGDDLSDYTPPIFVPSGLTDWTTYEYELPAFNETEVPTSDFTNVVISTVSLPVPSGNIRYSGSLISEDGNTIRYDDWGIDQNQSAKIEGFNHLYWGTGSDGLQWIYGEASTPEQYELRTGTATFRGGLIGYYADGDFDNNTVYQDINQYDTSGNDVEGRLILNVDFSSNTLTGNGVLDINTPVRNENLSFSLDQTSITASNSGLTRSLGFRTNASLDNGVAGSGNFSGTFYGSDASEAAGSFGFGLSGGFVAGVWAVGENYTFGEGQGDNVSIRRITSQSPSRFITDAGISSGVDTDPNFTDVPVDQGAGGGEVWLVNKFNDDSATDPYTYTSWGDWVANDNTIPNFSEGGYWVTADTMTPASVIENRTGTASYSGNIVGDYVSNNTRQDATGQINLTADFSADTIQGQMQFGHDGAGTNAGGTVSPVANLVDVPIQGNSFSQSAVDQNTGNGLNSFGVSGFFAGPNAEEVGGTAWMHLDDGSYNGVFRAGQ